MSATPRCTRWGASAGTGASRKAIGFIHTLTNCDMLYIGGGNAKHLQVDLPHKVRIVSNEAGITGGIRLWDAKLDEMFVAV